MRMGRRWEWFGICVTVVMVLAWSGIAVGQESFGDWLFKVNNQTVTKLNFGAQVTENTAVIAGEFRLVEHQTIFPDPVGVVKVIVHDTALNRVIFNTQINIEFSGDTILIPMHLDSITNTGFYSYGDYSIPFTMSFRPNTKGVFNDTLPFQVVYPKTFNIPSGDAMLPVSGRGIGFLRLLPPRSGTPVDSGVVVNFDALAFSTTGDKTDTLRVGKAWPRSFGIINTSTNRVGKVSDVFPKRPEYFIVSNPQLEIQPGNTEFVQVLFTPRTLSLHIDTLRLVSDDFAVDTPKVALSGTGELTFDASTGDVDTLDNKIIYDSLQWRQQLAGGYRDTVLLFSNRIDKRILGDVTAKDGSTFKVLRLRGVDTASVDTLVAIGGKVTYREKSYNVGDTILIGTVDTLIAVNNQVTYLRRTYYVGDTLIFGANTYVVGDTTILRNSYVVADPLTVVPSFRRIDVTLADSVAVWLRFQPTKRRQYHDSLLLTYRPFLQSDTLALRIDTLADSAGQVEVLGAYPMFGRGIGSHFYMVKTSIDFGPLTPPLKRTDTLIVRNDSGQVALTVTLDTAGVDPVFTLRSDRVFTVGVGQSANIIWEYAAVDNVLHTGSVPVTTNDPNNPSATISLSGGSQAPLIVTDVKTLNFGNVVIGDSLQKTFRVSNNGLTLLSVTGITFSKPIQYKATPTAFDLVPGAFTDVTVTFKPTAPDSFNDRNVVVTTNDPKSPSYGMTMLGGGSNPSFSSGTSIVFGVTTLGSGFLVDSFVVHNGGTRGNMSVRIKPLHGTSFTLARPADSLISVGPGADRWVPVRFSQTDTAVVTDSLILWPSDLAVDSAFVALSGGGYFRQLDWYSGPLKTGTSYDFGKVSLTWPDTLTSQMTNLGNQPLQVLEVMLYDGGQGFKRLTPSSGQLLQNEFFNVTIVFTPPTTGLYYDTMMIVTDDTTSGNDTIIVPLVGDGFVLGLHPGADPFWFDTTQVAGSRIDSVALMNTGDSAIYIDNAWLAQATQFALILPDTISTVITPGTDTIKNFTYRVPPTGQIWLKAKFSPTDTLTFFDTASVLGAYTLDTIYYDTMIITTISTNPLIRDTTIDTVRVELIPTSPDVLTLPLEGTGAGGRYADNVDSLWFAPVLPFGSSTRQFIVTNTGNQPLALTSIAVKGGSGSSFKRQSPATVAVGAAEQATVTIQFQPLASNAFQDQLIVLTDDPAMDSVIIPLYGETNDQDIDFSIGRLSQIANHSIVITTPVAKSKSQTLKIFNVGLTDLFIFGASLDVVGPPSPWSFVASLAQNKTIKPHDSLVLSLVFDPKFRGTYNNAMTILSDDPDESTTRVTITGVATSGQLSVVSPDTAQWRLGAVKVNTTVISPEVRIRNVFGSSVKLSLGNWLSPAPEFVVERSINGPTDTTRTWLPLNSADLPTLTSNQIMSLRVKYSPVDTGADNNTFRVVGTQDAAGDTIDIKLFARGAAPAGRFNPGFWDFGERVIVPSWAPDTSYRPDSMGTATVQVVNDGVDTLRLTQMTRANSGAAAYNDPTTGMAGYSALPFTVPPHSTRNFLLFAKPLTRKIYYDTLIFVTNDPNQPTMLLQTRMVGIAPGDIGTVDTVRITGTEWVGSQVVVPVHLIHDEPLKRLMIPLKYTSDIYECVGIDFRETLLETVDGRLPTIDTVANTVVIKATAIFTPPILPNEFVGTQVARLLFRAKAGVVSTDSTITIDTLAALDTSSVQFVLQDTAGQVILPVFVSGRLDVRTDVDDGAVIPQSYALEQNFPNPFNPRTTIAFEIPRAGHVRLTVFNLLGQRIETLVDEVLPAGRREVEWNGRDQYGREVSSGVYFYRLSAEEFNETKKMILMK